MNWFDCLLAFKKVAEQQSFIGAARELNTMNSVITKRIQWLEEKLSCSLFLRTTRKVILTDTGEHLFNKINPLLDEWQDIHAQITDYKDQPQGEITLCLPPNFGGIPRLANVLHQFLKEYPRLKLHITHTHQAIDLLNAKVDILIAPERYLLDQTSVVGVKLADFSYQCFAAPAYLKKQGEPKKPEDLKKHNCIIYHNSNQWEFSGQPQTLQGSLRADAADSLKLACVSGIGLIYIPPFFVADELKQGLIKPILNKFPGKKDRLMIFYPKHAYKPRKIALLLDYLRQHVKL